MRGSNLAAVLDNLFGGSTAESSNTSALDKIVCDKRRSAHGLEVGDQMALDCLVDLTAACIEIANPDGAATKSTVADLNGTRDLTVFGTGTFALACDALADKWNLSWFNTYCRDLAPRVRQGFVEDVDRLADVILTKVMQGEIASSVVKACDLPITTLVLNAAAGLQTILASLGSERLTTLLNGHRDRFDLLGFQKTTCIFLQRLMERDDLLQLFREERQALYGVQLYLVNGDKEVAKHNLWVLRTALGLREETQEDTADSTADTPAEPTGNGHTATQPEWVRPIPNAVPPVDPREPALVD